MPEINWGLGVMPDIGGNAMQAFEQGRARKQQELGQNALTAYATDPSDGNLNALAQYQPEFVIRQRQAHATAGNKQREETAKYVANAAFHIVTLPPEQRAAAWDAYIDQGAQQHPDIAQYKGQYTPQALDALVAEAGQSQAFQTFQKPTYVPIGEMGLAGFQYGQPIQQGGQPQNFGQGPQMAQTPQGAPQPGTIEDGHRFKGGDPANPASWEEVGPQGAQLLSREQYQGAVNSLGKEAADAWIQRNGFSVGN